MKIKLFILSVGIVGSAILAIGCATAITPHQFNERMPTLTTSKFYDRILLNEAVQAGNCKVLVANRKYTAPIEATHSGDLKSGAKGIDEWVKIDGGNAYSILNYEWVSIGEGNTAQLVLNFDTLKCK